MSTALASLAVIDPDPEVSVGPSLAEVFERIPSVPGLSSQARQNMRSAIRTLCRVLDREARDIPIAAPALRALLDGASPGAVGISVSRWRNVKSDVRRAIKHSGIATTLRLADQPLTAEWETLVSTIPEVPARSIVRRFARFAVARAVSPEQVNDAAAEAYRHDLNLFALSRQPDRTADELIRHWNRHVASLAGSALNTLSRPNRSRAYTLAWKDFPSSLKAEVDAFHEACRHPDPLEPDARRPVRVSTIEARDRQLRRIATAMTLRGIRADELRDLAALVRPERVEAALRFFLARNDGKPNVQVRDVSGLLLTIARHWVQASDDQLKPLRLWAKRFEFTRNGLTEKNLSRLRQFTNPEVIRRFVGLPGHLSVRARSLPPSIASARLMQVAVAIGVLIHAPIRLGNLANLDRQRHFHWGYHQGERQLYLSIPAAEVKNDVDLSFPLPKQIQQMVERYMASYQPMLNPIAGTHLFPGRSGGAKSTNTLRRQIAATVKKELGLYFNPHLVRHLAAYLFLTRNPGHYEEVRRILGHKSLATTMRSYTGLETEATMRRYDSVILDLSETPTLPHRRGRLRLV